MGHSISEIDNLVAGAKKGDPAAARALVETCWDMVCRYAIRTGTKPSDVEDVAQEVFLKTFRSIDSYMPGTNFRGWLIKITTNCCIDLARAKASRPESVQAEINPSATHDDNPGQAAELNEIEEALERAIQALPNPERRILVLRVFENFSHREIARAVGKTETTVRWNLCQARKKLRDSLSDFL